MSTILIALEPDLLPQELRERIQSLKPEAQLIVTNRHEEMEAVLDEIEIAAGHFPIQLIPRSKNLRWVQQWGAGTDWLMHHPEIAGLDFILTNASGVHAIPISEHILAFLLAFARCLPVAIHAQQKHEWSSDMAAFELAGKTMLLIGVGAIGRRTAQTASAMGMRILGIRRNPSKAIPEIEEIYGPDRLHDLLPQADFVVLTLPLTGESQHMFDAQAFERMKRSSYLINIGRGGTVDELALIRALQTGQIAGAGLDVFEEEPLPPDSPLWDMENVIITAHYSGETPHYDERALKIFMENLERYASGQPLKNVVDKKSGY